MATLHLKVVEVQDTERLVKQLARQIFDREGRAEIIKLLERGEIENAKDCLLIGIDVGYLTKKITYLRAKILYRQLALSPDHCQKVRQATELKRYSWPRAFALR